MKKSVCFALFLIVVLFASCWNDYPRLGKNYVYCNRIIARTEMHGKSELLFFLITEQVLNYNFNRDYIIAYQIPDTNYLGSRDLLKARMTEEQRDSLDRQFEEMLRIHDCYWIIRKEDCKVFGPMTKHDFDMICQELVVGIMLDPRYEKDFADMDFEKEDTL